MRLPALQLKEMACRLMQSLKLVVGRTAILSPNFMRKPSSILDPHSPGRFEVSHLPPWRWWRRQWRNNYIIERDWLVRWSLILNYFVKSSSSESWWLPSLGNPALEYQRSNYGLEFKVLCAQCTWGSALWLILTVSRAAGGLFIYLICLHDSEEEDLTK